MKKIFLIGEIGINHNGSIKIAKKIISEAKKRGFDAVKFQKETLMFQLQIKKNMKSEILLGAI